MYSGNELTKAFKMSKENLYTYAQLLRPFDTGTYVKEGFIKFVPDEKYNHKGYLEYSKPLSIEQIESKDLAPISEVLKYDGIKVFYHDKNIANVSVHIDDTALGGYKRNSMYKNIPMVHLQFLNESGEQVDKEVISGLNFMKKLKSGRYQYYPNFIFTDNNKTN